MWRSFEDQARQDGQQAMPARLLVGDDAAGKEVVPCRREVEATAVVVAGFLEVKTPGLVVQVGRKTKRRPVARQGER